MEGSEEKNSIISKILIFGGTGYLGEHMVKASLALGHQTYVYVRPLAPKSSPSKLQLHKDFESMGVTIFQGELSEHEKLVAALRQVDVVISALAVPQYLDQLKIIEAMKEAGNIKRFVPSEYGNEVDRVHALPPFQAILNNKKKIRRATEMANIPYTFVSGNTFAGYFVDYLLHPNDQKVEQLSVYGTGDAKAVLNYERDIATYTIKAAVDARACNRIMIVRPPKNITCQNDLISAWESKTGKKFKKIHIPEGDLLRLSKSLPHPDNIPIAIIHNIFVKGEQLGFDLSEDDLEASELFPDYEYTSIYRLLDIFATNPPKPKCSVFA